MLKDKQKHTHTQKRQNFHSVYVCVCVFVINNFKIREYFLLRILDSIELIRILRNCMNPQDLNVKVSKDSSKILETYETLLSVT